MIWKWADLQVQIGPVSHESWWAHNSGSIAVAVAAILAAGLAAYVAITNRREELAQDRELHERAHIRDTLDRALENIDRSISVNAEANAVARAARTVEDQQKKEELEDRLKPLLAAAMADETALRGGQVRLELRLGKNHAVATAHQKLVNELSAWADTANALARSSDSSIPDDAGTDQASEAFAAFRAACRTWFEASPAPARWPRRKRRSRQTAAS